MKNSTIVKAIAVALLTGSVGLAAASDTQNLTVSASVSGVCKFTAGTPTLDFGTIDPSGTAAIPGTASAVSYKCTKGTAATGVTADNGLNFSATKRMKGPGAADFIPYTLTITGGTATGDGFGTGSTTDPVNITGSIAAADYQNASAGAYTDTIVLSINP